MCLYKTEIDASYNRIRLFKDNSLPGSRSSSNQQAELAGACHESQGQAGDGWEIGEGFPWSLCLIPGTP